MFLVGDWHQATILSIPFCTWSKVIISGDIARKFMRQLPFVQENQPKCNVWASHYGLRNEDSFGCNSENFYMRFKRGRVETYTVNTHTGNTYTRIYIHLH